MALAGAAYRSAFSSSNRVCVCAGLTLGKLYAGWRGTVRQPATSTSNNRRVHLKTTPTVGRRCRDAQTAAKTSEAMFLLVRSLTPLRSPTQRSRQSSSFALPESGAELRRVRKSAGNSTAAMEFIFRKKMFMPVGRRPCRQAMSSFAPAGRNSFLRNDCRLSPDLSKLATKVLRTAFRQSHRAPRGFFFLSH